MTDTLPVWALLLTVIGGCTPSVTEVAPTSIPSASLAFEALEPLGFGEPDRLVVVDLTRWQRPGADALVYSVHEVLQPVVRDDLSYESELSVAVRLVLSEVGPERLVANAFGLEEAVGILETVRNRLDPARSNPSDIEGAPTFPGCGVDGEFRSCADPDEYLGLKTWRALRPEQTADPEIVAAATDLAVTAWWLVDNGLTDVSEGATSYVHRCGGAAYGHPTWRCDAHMGRPARDIPGADPYAGPVLFKGPDAFDERRGFYQLSPTAWVDYIAGDAPPVEAFPL